MRLPFSWDGDSFAPVPDKPTTAPPLAGCEKPSVNDIIWTGDTLWWMETPQWTLRIVCVI